MAKTRPRPYNGTIMTPPGIDARHADGRRARQVSAFMLATSMREVAAAVGGSYNSVRDYFSQAGSDAMLELLGRFPVGTVLIRPLHPGATVCGSPAAAVWKDHERVIINAAVEDVVVHRGTIYRTADLLDAAIVAASAALLACPAEAAETPLEPAQFFNDDGKIVSRLACEHCHTVLDDDPEAGLYCCDAAQLRRLERLGDAMARLLVDGHDATWEEFCAARDAWWEARGEEPPPSRTTP